MRSFVLPSIFFLFWAFLHVPAQTVSPAMAPLPESIANLDLRLMVNHFDDPVFATTDPDEPELYFWKHTTTVLSPFADAEIIRFGAYIYYNDQWNLRVEMEPKDFVKLFDCPKARLKKGQPYTFKDNWRRDKEPRGGWAMWYFVAKQENGDTVGGIGKLYTAGATYAEARYTLDPERSSLKWTGHSAWTDYAPDGALDFKAGELLYADGQLWRTQVSVHLSSMRSETGGIAEHLRTADFFDVSNFPTADFALSEAVELNGGAVTVEGKFSFHGTSAQARVPLEITVQENEIVARGTVVLNRSAFGIERSLPTEKSKKTQGSEIADGFEVEVEAVFVRK